MIDRTTLAALAPKQRADLIYREVQSDLAQGLWRAALGTGHDEDSGGSIWGRAAAEPHGIEALMALMSKEDGPEPATDAQARNPNVLLSDDRAETVPSSTESSLRIEALGPNARFGDSIVRAAERTGLPASALAAIVDAEAARAQDGSWNVHSRNPRSSAAGLGQFLSGTWEGEAERPGTWLNGEARRRGWLSEGGQVLGEARSALLSLRYDPEASIQAIADYAHGNLQRLSRAGVQVGSDVSSIAHAAYIGHHLAPVDAARFLGGGLDPARAQRLLSAQVGAGEAARRLSQAGDATDAHRRWLLAYTSSHVNPQRYA